MHQFVYRFLLAVLLFSLTGCEKEKKPIPQADVVYSFFVAGHTYGEPGVNNAGLHPPLVEKFSLINADSLLQFGVLTGDIVVQCTNYDFDEVDDQLTQLNMPVYFAPGNHDLIYRSIYEERYGRTYFSFEQNSDLFVVLDPGLDYWNVSGDQLEFLDSVLLHQAPEADHVFVFFHQVLWWDETNKYKNVTMNSSNGRADTINFWTEVEPRFHNLEKPVFMFAGDVGAYPTGQEFMYDTYDNITLIASGMGGGSADNFVIADVRADQSVTFRLISLNTPTIDGLGKLEDYVLTP